MCQGTFLIRTCSSQYFDRGNQQNPKPAGTTHLKVSTRRKPDRTTRRSTEIQHTLVTPAVPHTSRLHFDLSTIESDPNLDRILNIPNEQLSIGSARSVRLFLLDAMTGFTLVVVLE